MILLMAFISLETVKGTQTRGNQFNLVAFGLAFPMAYICNTYSIYNVKKNEELGVCLMSYHRLCSLCILDARNVALSLFVEH